MAPSPASLPEQPLEQPISQAAAESSPAPRAPLPLPKESATPPPLASSPAQPPEHPLQQQTNKAATLGVPPGSQPKVQALMKSVPKAAVAKDATPAYTRFASVLACHVGRVGDVHGPELKRVAVECFLQAANAEARKWWRGDGEKSFNDFLVTSKKLYKKVSCPTAFREVCMHLASSSKLKGYAQEVLPDPFDAPEELSEKEPDWHPPALGPLLAEISIPLSLLRFAHNDDSEMFRQQGVVQRSILLTAIELISGITPAEKIPTFLVCHHEDRWYCRDGNRRLAAFRLAAMLRPDKFKQVRVRLVPTDDIFLKGRKRLGMRPKLTTARNGAACKGKWMRITQTGQFIGLRRRKGTFGLDLLDVVFRPMEKPLSGSLRSAQTLKLWSLVRRRGSAPSLVCLSQKALDRQFSMAEEDTARAVAARRVPLTAPPWRPRTKRGRRLGRETREALEAQNEELKRKKRKERFTAAGACGEKGTGSLG
eukprot:TRINITY_DN29086_c0_g1_i2.p1 TRINITY_DN29086_c0_g1~~TRINITY_DN29086_c0_g1_i2.p1  ORF type:complete len:530 (+),score=100.15 TRINITY_DN29086_c0_g1_i2:148-1590(+)